MRISSSRTRDPGNEVAQWDSTFTHSPEFAGRNAFSLRSLNQPARDSDQPFDWCCRRTAGGTPPVKGIFVPNPRVNVLFNDKGIDSALYLLLFRFLHREYAASFRLSDAVATDIGFQAPERHLEKSARSLARFSPTRMLCA